MEVLKVKLEMEAYLSKNYVDTVQHSFFYKYFLCMSFKDAVIGSDYIVLNGRVINE